MNESERVASCRRVLIALTLITMMFSIPALSGNASAEAMIQGMAYQVLSGGVMATDTAKPLMTGPVNEEKLITLEGNTRSVRLTRWVSSVSDSPERSLCRGSGDQG